MNCDEFKDIRPYRDEDMPAVFARLLANQEFLDALLSFRQPRLAAWLPWLMRPLTAAYLRRRTARLRSVDDFQSSLESLFDYLIAHTTKGFTWSGLEALDPQRACLFVSNHRDIAMDSAFVNYATHAEGHGTVRIAIGDNLLGKNFVADLMRLNKSFIVRRSFTGLKDQYAAFRHVSAYLHHSISVDQHSVWIAQREGRAKDGDDRTDPAILKMFYVSQRKSDRSFSAVLADLHIIPVAISYELDPCAGMKAHELSRRELGGSYEKSGDEDLHSIIAGITGAKGRVHVHFGAELTAPAEQPEQVAEGIDTAIHDGFKLYPTHLEAACRIGMTLPPALGAAVPERDAGTMAAFDAVLASAPEHERGWILRQYAQPVRAYLAAGGARLPASDSLGIKPG